MAYVLVHSPLVGTLTWSRVALALRERGAIVLTPDLADDGTPPFWRQHVDAVIEAIESLPVGEPVILAGHSAAGLLLPQIGAASPRPVTGYLFVDAGLPIDGLSRLDVVDREDPELGRYFREMLADGGTFPRWDVDALSGLVPDSATAVLLVRDLRPRTAPFFMEPIPVPASWPDAPCGYLQFGSAYDRTVARIDGWPLIRLDAGHFHQLVDPEGVSDAMTELVTLMAGR